MGQAHTCGKLVTARAWLTQFLQVLGTDIDR
jgi:hypothetical protein